MFCRMQQKIYLFRISFLFNFKSWMKKQCWSKLYFIFILQKILQYLKSMKNNFMIFNFIISWSLNRDFNEKKFNLNYSISYNSDLNWILWLWKGKYYNFIFVSPPPPSPQEYYNTLSDLLNSWNFGRIWDFYL